MTREDDLQFIKEFSKITISQICRDLNVDRGNLMNGRAGESTTKLVKEELVKRLTALIG